MSSLRCILCVTAAAAMAALPVAPSLAAGADKPTDLEAARAAYQVAREKVAAARTGAEGLAVWQEFLAKFGDSPLAEPARSERDIWRGRAEKNLARFGPGWLVKSEVDKKNAAANALLSSADAAAELDAAAKLYAQAAVAHPFRPDIPFRKAMRYYKAGRFREAGLAFGEALKADPDFAAARNNMGVMAACEKGWPAAVAHLARAAAVSADDRIWDNLDQAMASAEAAGCPKSQLAVGQRQVQAALSSLHRLGKHVGETRWGNSWISEKDFQDAVKANEQADRVNETNTRKLALAKKMHSDLEAEQTTLKRRLERLGDDRGDDRDRRRLTAQLAKAADDLKKVDDAAARLEAENREAASKKKTPSHAGRYVLLDADGERELGKVDPSAAESAEGDKDRPDPRPRGRGGSLFD